MSAETTSVFAPLPFRVASNRANDDGGDASASHRVTSADNERQRYVRMCFSPCGGVLCVAFDCGSCVLVEINEARTIHTLQTGRREISALKWLRVPALACCGDGDDSYTRALHETCKFKSVRFFVIVIEIF